METAGFGDFMKVDDLRELVKRNPFEPFTIHMNDGSQLKVTQPDNFFAPPTWKLNAIVALDSGRFSILYIKNIAHVTTRGDWPKFKSKRRRSEFDTDE
jgi:hypothetical protein